jgi:dephospho-CoA kinase
VAVRWALEALCAAGLDVCALGLDSLAHEVMDGSPDLLDALAQAFGPEVIAADGTLDRAALAARAFVDDDHTFLLNDMVHPAVIARTQARMAEAENQGCDLALIEAPLLPRYWFPDAFIIAVTAPEEMRLARLLARGYHEADARSRMARQPMDALYKKEADLVIANTSTEERLREDIVRGLRIYADK